MSEDRARNRFIVIQAMRWIGTALALVGLLVINRKIDLPIEAGYALFVIGLLDALVMPTLLARRWKSPNS
ncbi:hypothetical protein [Novosphingobium sp. JCM 18896]|uniref:hypothetical protein n=1 Tax=Novosphingobium sp. JCM 18896 TaxID=2989731 RepID=UPI002223B014|nr:hypothetical protein [Novosphingobium sp. JCM 18896]MCW1427734.1 hypothetical protein [Novosphingobium sp. JCM 18896]